MRSTRPVRRLPAHLPRPAEAAASRGGGLGGELLMSLRDVEHSALDGVDVSLPVEPPSPLEGTFAGQLILFATIKQPGDPFRVVAHLERLGKVAGSRTD